MDFHVHLPTFLWQLRCCVKRIIRKRLSDSSIHNSVIIRLSGQSFLLQFRLLCNCSEFPRQLILKLTIDVHDWIALWTSKSKTVIPV